MAVTQVAYEIDGWGTGELVVADSVVVWHEAPWPRAHTPLVPAHPGPGHGIPRDVSPEMRGFVADVITRLRAYFDGDCAGLEDVPVDVEHETPFRTRCAEELRATAPGDVVTYGELAALAGAPGAARAAGSFCARNRLSLFVPCHRVVAASGLGSYGSAGVAYKRRLLALEGYAGAL